jgi:hypothetical protein
MVIKIPNGHKNPKCPKNIPNGHKISQMSVKYSKWPYNISTFSHPRPSKICPNWYFWFENEPSGNPVAHIKNSKGPDWTTMHCLTEI